MILFMIPVLLVGKGCVMLEVEYLFLLLLQWWFATTQWVQYPILFLSGVGSRQYVSCCFDFFEWILILLHLFSSHVCQWWTLGRPGQVLSIPSPNGEEEPATTMCSDLDQGWMCPRPNREPQRGRTCRKSKVCVFKGETSSCWTLSQCQYWRWDRRVVRWQVCKPFVLLILGRSLPS